MSLFNRRLAPHAFSIRNVGLGLAGLAAAMPAQAQDYVTRFSADASAASAMTTSAVDSIVVEFTWDATTAPTDPTPWLDRVGFPGAIDGVKIVSLQGVSLPTLTNVSLTTDDDARNSIELHAGCCQASNTEHYAYMAFWADGCQIEWSPGNCLQSVQLHMGTTDPSWLNSPTPDLSLAPLIDSHLTNYPEFQNPTVVNVTGASLVFWNATTQAYSYVQFGRDPVLTAEGIPFAPMLNTTPELLKVTYGSLPTPSQNRTVTLDAYDLNGDSFTTAWAVISTPIGANGSFSQQGPTSAVFNGNRIGMYDYEVTMTDSTGKSATYGPFQVEVKNEFCVTQGPGDGQAQLVAVEHITCAIERCYGGDVLADRCFQGGVLEPKLDIEADFEIIKFCPEVVPLRLSMVIEQLLSGKKNVHGDLEKVTRDLLEWNRLDQDTSTERLVKQLKADIGTAQQILATGCN